MIMVIYLRPLELIKGEMPIVVPILLVEIDRLRPHEEFVEEHVKELMEDIVKVNVLIKPILVDSRTYIILDGHHRVEALKRLGSKYVPAVLVDYRSECIRVTSWRENVRVDKELVLRAGLSGKLLPPKTSRHMPCIEIPEVNVPLSILKGRVKSLRVLGELRV